MRTLLFSCSFLLFIFFLWLGVSAFQNNLPKSPTQNNDKKIFLEIEQKRSAAEAFAYQGDFDGCLVAYQKLYEECLSLNLIEKSYAIFEEMLSIEIQNPFHKIQEKLDFLQKSHIHNNNKKLQPFFYAALAQLYISENQLDSLQKYYNLAYQHYLELNQHYFLANLQLLISYNAYSIENLNLAKNYIDLAEIVLTSKLAPQNIHLKDFYHIKSIIYNELGDYNTALKSCLSNIKELEIDSTTHSNKLAVAYGNLATTYTYIGDLFHALTYYNKQLNIFKQDETTSSDFIGLYYNIGSTYTDLGKYELAKKHYFLSLNHLAKEEELTDDMVEHFILNYLQLTNYYMQFDIDSAEYYVLKAKEVQKDYPYRTTFSKSAHASIHLLKKDFVNAQKEAVAALNDALEIYGYQNDIVASCYYDCAKILYTIGNKVEALRYSQKALEASSIGFSDENGVKNPKLNQLRYKNQLSTILHQKLDIMQSLLDEGNSLFKKEDLLETVQFATQVLEVVSRSLKSSESKKHWLNKEAIPTFEKAIKIATDAYVETQNSQFLNEAFMLSERSKSMLMMEALQESNAVAYGGIPDSLLQQEQATTSALEKANKLRLDAIESNNSKKEKTQDSLIFVYTHQLDKIKHIYEQKYPKYYQLKYAIYTASIQDIQSKLDEKTTLVEYFEGNNSIYAFSISKNSSKINIIPKEIDYSKQIHQFQSLLTDIKLFLKKPSFAYNEFVASAYNLYDKFLKNNLFENTNRIIIIPDGQLGYIPFETLLSQKVASLEQSVKKVDFSDAPFVLNSHSISYNYSATLLISQQESKHKVINNKILALAPKYSGEAAPEWRGEQERGLRNGLIKLPGAAEEVSKLGLLFEGSFVVGDDANETLFKKEASNYGILHLAMHGLVDPHNPEYSSLALAEDNSKNEDNFLYAYEIKQLALNSNLVVLSACETGIGKYQRGEGVVSLGRGFMYAGTPALLMTLWVLNDQSGALIIEDFYKNLSTGMEKDVAIQQAKLSYLKNTSPNGTHPFLWAAFVQVGDYNAILIDAKRNFWIYGISLVALLGGLILFLMYRKKQAQ